MALGTPARSARFPFLLTAAAALALASVGAAAPVDADHRFERIGMGAEDPIGLLPVPGAGRALILQRDGTLLTVAGDGLAREELFHVPVKATCGNQGLLGATWGPDGTAHDLYVTYVADGSGAFAVGHLTLDDRRTVTSFTEIHVQPFAAACENLGGGIAFGWGDKLFVGVGDMGNATAAGSQATLTGKILRMNTDGSLPDDPPNPVNPASFTYGFGVRDPFRMTRDELTGAPWFLDAGPGVDELNALPSTGPVNFGWGSSMQHGFIGIGTDPMYVWSPTASAGGIAVYGREELGDYAGRVLVATGLGELTAVMPDFFDPLRSVEDPLVTADPGGPAALVDLAVLGDGFVYAIDAEGVVFRLIADTGFPAEPSSRDSVLPMLLEKLPDGRLLVSVERMNGVETHGIYPGDLNAMRAAGAYQHVVPPDSAVFHDGTAGDGDSYMRFVMSMDDLDPDPTDGEPAPADGYLLVSSRNSRGESGLGTDGFTLEDAVRGAPVTFSCEAGCEGNKGVYVDQCLEDYTVQWGLWNRQEIGPISFETDFDCQVIVMGLAADWCGWCHVAAPELQRMYEDYGDLGFTMIELIFEDGPGVIATQQTVWDWQDRHNNTHPLLLDEARRNNDRWFQWELDRRRDEDGDGDPTNDCDPRNFDPTKCCGGYPQYFIFNADGLQTDFVCGADTARIEQAVRRNLGL